MNLKVLLGLIIFFVDEGASCLRFYTVYNDMIFWFPGRIHSNKI